jgi:hypothetical protein
MRIYLLIGMLQLSVLVHAQTKPGTTAHQKSSIDMTIKEKGKENKGSTRVTDEEAAKVNPGKAKESFEDFIYFDEYEFGITLTEAKKKYEDFFKKTVKRNTDFGEVIMTIGEDYDSLYGKERLQAFYIKNDRLYGFAGFLYEGADDKSYSKGNKKVNEIVSRMKAICDFPYKETRISSGAKGEIVRKLWEKNGKTFFIQHAKIFVAEEHHSSVAIYLMDEKYALKKNP